MFTTLFFDLGGVLVDVRPDVAGARFAALTGAPAARFVELVFLGDAHLRLSRGELAPAVFFAEVAAQAGAGTDPGAVASAWQAMLAPRTDVFARVARLGSHFRLGIISDTDPCHLETMLAWPGALFAPFDPVVTSFALGCHKPDRRIFEAACARAGCRPSEAAFFDDRAENVAGARAVGLTAHEVASRAALDAALGGYEAAASSGTARPA